MQYIQYTIYIYIYRNTHKTKDNKKKHKQKHIIYDKDILWKAYQQDPF